MKQSELPKCPTCGAMPEYSWRERSYGTSHGLLKCPHGHHEVSSAFLSGFREEAARPKLIERWLELVAEQLRQGAEE